MPRPSAIPVTIGLALASGLGLALGNVLAAIVNLSPAYDRVEIALMAAAGAAVIVAATLLTLPTLSRMMRPEALRVERSRYPLPRRARTHPKRRLSIRVGIACRVRGWQVPGGDVW